jgi:hypothetical protein
LATFVTSSAKQLTVVVAVNTGVIPVIDTVEGVPLVAVAVPRMILTVVPILVPAQAPAAVPHSVALAPDTVKEASGKDISLPDVELIASVVLVPVVAELVLIIATLVASL